MPQIHIEGAEDFAREVLFAMGSRLAIRDRIWEEIQEVSRDVKERIKDRMPLDYGDAMNRWGTPEHHMLNPHYKGALANGIWREDRLNLSITQGAALEPYEYILRLNEGSSTQAPVGFIDTEVEHALDELDIHLAEAVVHVFGSTDIAYGGGRSTGGFKPGQRAVSFKG